jgi:hypothetical protein
MVFEDNDRSQRNVTDLALGCANGEVGFIPARDLDDFVALKCGANMQRGH